MIDLLCKMHLNHLNQICAKHDINYSLRGQSFENIIKLLWSANLTNMPIPDSQGVTCLLFADLCAFEDQLEGKKESCEIAVNLLASEISTTLQFW